MDLSTANTSQHYTCTFAPSLQAYFCSLTTRVLLLPHYKRSFAPSLSKWHVPRLQEAHSPYGPAVVSHARAHTHTCTRLRSHRWHMDYMDLLVRKRMALAAWRAKRDQQRSKAQAQAALLETETAAQASAAYGAA
eukprot:scaffold161562_cov26-Tisochrysis_lutea.AAC.2